PYVLGKEVTDGFLLNGVQIAQQRIGFLLEHPRAPSERVMLQLTLTAGVLSQWHWTTRYELSVDPPEERLSPSAQHAVAALKEAIGRNADAAFWRRILADPGSAIDTVSWNGTAAVAPAPFALALVVFGLMLVVGAIAVRRAAAARPWRDLRAASVRR